MSPATGAGGRCTTTSAPRGTGTRGGRSSSSWSSTPGGRSRRPAASSSRNGSRRWPRPGERRRVSSGKDNAVSRANATTTAPVARFKWNDLFRATRRGAMGGCRVGIIAIALAIAIPLLMASAASPISLHREPVPIRPATLPGPVPVPGIVLPPWNPAGTVAGPLAVTANATLIPVGPDHRVTNNPAPQNEGSVAMNPRNGRDLPPPARERLPRVPGPSGGRVVRRVLDPRRRAHVARAARPPHRAPHAGHRVRGPERRVRRGRERVRHLPRVQPHPERQRPGGVEVRGRRGGGGGRGP